MAGCRQLGGGGGGFIHGGFLVLHGWLSSARGGGGVYTLTKIHGAACLSSARVVGTNRVQGPLSNIP
ncbi:hypothetical protein EV2_029580 [Malus domestica]